jgi:hypothetical protein
MATYYVSTSTGNDSWTGLSATFTSGSTGPWKTLGKALGAAGMASGDILYIAPGNYNESVTIGFAPSAATQIIGDSNSQYFGGVTAGPVLISAFNAAGTSETVTANLIIAASRNYFEWSNIWWKTTTGKGVSATNARYWKFTNCVFENTAQGGIAGILSLSSVSATALDATITRCRFSGGNYGLLLVGGNVSDTSTVTSCLFDGGTQPIELQTIQAAITNCTFLNYQFGITQRTGSLSFVTTVRNCVWVRCAAALQSVTSGHMTENFNRFLGASRTNMGTLGANSTTGGDGGLDLGYLLQTNGNYLQTYTPYTSSPNTAFGTTTSAPATDLYNVSWNGASPDAGAITYRVITSLPSQVAYNGGIERNASTITIAPGSTSQSIELYLGATGLTASTSGLSARYNRTRTASVSISLVARTIAQAWTSGGFAEVDATNMPGVYRLDLPDAALASGADDVTIVVRGASGTNGAVMTVKLSSGGLTSAQTASAIFNAATADYTANGTYGLNLLRADQQNKQGLVTLASSGGINRVDADVHAIANDTDAATELKGALLHNGTDYISADLLTPVSAATSVHIGPYQLLADGLGADQPLDVNVGTATSIDVQITDANGTGIDITGATVTAKVYSSAGTLVATYSGTATYADNGRLTFGLTTTVTNTSGTYTVTVTRTTGATDTQIFGPLRLYVRPV